MKYPDGQVVKVGDKVKLWDECYGVVVASIEDDRYSDNYPKDEWDYLRSGVLILSDKAGLIHYLEPERSLELLDRSA